MSEIDTDGLRGLIEAGTDLTHLEVFMLLDELDRLRDRLAAVEALMEECAESDCIHLNDLWGRLRDALATDPTRSPRGTSPC